MTRFGLCLGLLGFGATYANAQWTPTVLNSTGYQRVEGQAFSSSKLFGQAVPDSNGNDPHAILWNSSGTSFVDIHPSGFVQSHAFGASASSQVGMAAGFFQGSWQHAIVWHGTAASAIDLHPVSLGFSYSFAVGATDEDQVGYGGNGANVEEHALLWHGSASSVIDLNPSGFRGSIAYGTNGSKQFGYSRGPSNDVGRHASLWSGSAESMVDIHPTQFAASEIHGVSGDNQIGFVYDQNASYNHRASMWSNTAASFVDLEPTGYSYTTGVGISSYGQVGDGFRDGDPYRHALYWNGSASTMVDLHLLLANLPLQFEQSWATGIDDNGDVIGYGRTQSQQYAIKWTHVVPEPGTYLAIGTGLLFLIRSRRKAKESKSTLPSFLAS